MFNEVENIFDSKRRFEKNFKILSELGSGGFGTVFKVSNNFTGKIADVKIIHLKGNFCLLIRKNVNLIIFQNLISKQTKNFSEKSKF